MELESKLEESGGVAVPRVPGSREELELKLAEANKKVFIESHVTVRNLTQVISFPIDHHALRHPEQEGRGDPRDGGEVQEVHREGQERHQDTGPQVPWAGRAGPVRARGVCTQIADKRERSAHRDTGTRE